MKFGLIFVVVVLTGCAAYTPINYSHPKLGMTFLKKDQQSCEYEALKAAQVADPRYDVMYGQYDLQSRRATLQQMCMREKGYVIVE